MKKFFMMLAVAAMMVFAVSCGNDKKKDAKGEAATETVDYAKMAPADLAQALLKAAKSDDLAAFKAIFEVMDTLDDEDAEAAMAALSESDQMTIAFYAMAHMEEITGEKLDFDDEDYALEEGDDYDLDYDDSDIRALYDDAYNQVEDAYKDAYKQVEDSYGDAMNEIKDAYDDALKDLQDSYDDALNDLF